MKNLKYIVTGYAIFVVFAYASSAISGESLQNKETDTAVLEAKAQNVIEIFQKTLKGELMTAMQNGGPIAAVEICNEKAPQISEKINLEEGVIISRTSLKVRNPLNEPDVWEKQTLEAFELRKKNGESLDVLKASKYDGDVFTYLKPIPMMGMCATCHGSNIAKPLYTHIQKFYPNDKAIGFKPGDIRGAFIVKINSAD